MKRIGIRGRLTIIMVTTLVLAIIAASVLIRGLVYDNIIEQKLTVSKILTASIVHDIKYEYNYRKQVAIYSIISKYLNYHSIIEDIHYYATDSSTVAGARKDSVSLVEDFPTDVDPKIKDAIDFARPSMQVNQLPDGHLSIRSIAPVLQGTSVMGAIVVNISIDDINVILSEISYRIILILIIATVTLVAILYAFLHRSLLNRLSNFMSVTKEVAMGNYERKLNDSNSDELGQLALAFDQMTEDLRKSKIKIDNHNLLMDRKVKDATAELQKTYEDLKNAQGQIVLSEKMASLGILIAGIAHEINTPVSAISNIARNMDAKVSILPELLENFPSEHASSPGIIRELLADVIEKAKSNETKASFKVIRGIETLLRDRGVEDWRIVARTLGNLNFTDEVLIEKYCECFKDPKVFKLLETTGFIAHAARISETSTQKIHDIIHALKFYAYTDKDKVEPTHINESVKTSLVLISNRVKHLVDVRLDLAANLPIVACTSEIHQVWTVLLNNAVDAIEDYRAENDGKIAISTYLENDFVCVRISDNGGGIPEDIQRKIFDPFFTTKDIGKGTGLGLSIVSGIINKHGGKIEVSSEGEETTFVVQIPLSGLAADTEESKAALVSENSI